MNIGKSDWQQIDPSRIYAGYIPTHILNQLQNGVTTNEKKQTLCVMKIQRTYYAADMESSVKTKEEFWETLTNNPTEALLSFMIQREEVENHIFVDGYLKEISDFMYHQLSEIQKTLSNTLPVAIEDKELLSSIFHAAVDGLMSFMKQSKQSKMDWFTIPDIVPKCETSGE